LLENFRQANFDFMGDGRGYYDHEDIRTSLHHLALYG
jgi:hypothetical protein